MELVTRGLVEGAAEPSTIYRDPDHRLPPALDEGTLCVESGDVDDLYERASRGQLIGDGVNRTRRLAQRAANDVSPEVLADEASDVAREFGMQLTVLGPEQAAEMGMGMFMAVGRGSSNQPRFIALRSNPQAERDERGRLLALVGKGVTFDTGGISLKPPAGMDEMKTDKTGAATVIHAIATVAQLAPELPVWAVAPAVENMPGPHSARPGDVVRALNGKSVEITNTDAEGRLILGDAMTWAQRQGATHVVDVATLTGAMTRALGRTYTGGFGDPDGWWAEVAAAAARQGEPLWRMPLDPDLRKAFDSPYADMANVGTPEGSAIVAALFLREFVTVPWVHLDIAGSAYREKAEPWTPRGATGVMHATLVDLCLAGSDGPMSFDRRDRRERERGRLRRPGFPVPQAPGCARLPPASRTRARTHPMAARAGPGRARPVASAGPGGPRPDARGEPDPGAHDPWPAPDPVKCRHGGPYPGSRSTWAPLSPGERPGSCPTTLAAAPVGPRPWGSKPFAAA